MSSWSAAIVYFGLVFAAGFVLGAVRVTQLTPWVGSLSATLVELPFMLAISWWIARRLVARLRSPVTTRDLIATGWGGFGLLLLAEAALGLWAFGRSLEEQMQAWHSPEGLLGLAGQIGFALMPFLVGRSRAGRSRPDDPGPPT